MTIETCKPFGPAPGVFSSTGALTASGAFSNASIVLDDARTPASVVVRITQRFVDARGTFTLRADIAESATDDPQVLSDDGTWAIIDGTGAYAALRGRGRVTGTADHNRDLISRIYEGSVRLRGG